MIEIPSFEGKRNEHKSKKYKKRSLWRVILRKGLAFAMGAALLAAQIEPSAYAQEENPVYEENEPGDDAENLVTDIKPEGNGIPEGTESGENTGKTENPEEKQPVDGEEEPETPPLIEEEKPEPEVCVCESPCGEESANQECPVCAADYSKCAKMPEIDEVPEEVVSVENVAAEESMEDAETEEIVAQWETPVGTYFYDKDLRYRVLDSENRCVAVSTPVYEGAGTLVIPPTVYYFGEEFTVTEIERYGLQDSDNVTKIVMPDTITVLRESALRSCDNLEEVVFSSHLTEIEPLAFLYCKSLKTIRLPESIASVGSGAFKGCEQLTEVQAPDKRIAYDSGVFAECRSLDSMEGIFGSEVTKIPDSMFGGCYSLTEIVIPNNITAIGRGAFSSCKGLTKVTIPSSVQTIGLSAFERCESLKEVFLAEGVTTLESGVFDRCTALEEMEIPNSVTTLGTMTFAQCKSLKSVKLSAQLTRISDQMFLECSSLTEVTIPGRVTVIGEGAFGWCSALGEVTILSPMMNLESSAFNGCSSLRKMNVAVSAVEESGERKVVPVTVANWETVFKDCPTDRNLTFVTPDGKNLTEEDYALAVKAYRRPDGFSYDSEWWYGWKIPEFTAAVTYTVTANAGVGGTIVPSGRIPVAKGGDQAFTFTPDAGCQIKSVVVDGNAVTWDAVPEAYAETAETGKAGSYTFRNVDKDHTIVVNFETVSGGGTTGGDNPPEGGDEPDDGKGDSSGSGSKPEDGNGDSSGGGEYSYDGSMGSPAGDSDYSTAGNGDSAAAVSAAIQTGTADGQAVPASVTERQSGGTQAGQNGEPKTGDPSHAEVYATIAMIAGLGYLILYYMEERRGMTERAKNAFVAAFVRWAKKGGLFRKGCAMVAIFCILVYYHAIGGRMEEAAESRAIALHGKEA